MSDVDTIDDLLPEIDRDFLLEKHPNHTVKRVGADTHVVIRDFDFPAAYTPRKANLLIILPAGYPNANLDMFWTEPVVKLANGNWPDARRQSRDLRWRKLAAVVPALPDAVAPRHR